MFALFFLACLMAAAVDATDLASTITVNTTWSVSSSPFYLRSNVVIAEGVKVRVMNGVELVFAGDYTLVVDGILDFCQVDTSDVSTRGLANSESFGHVHADATLSRQGSIVFEENSPGRAEFCNVLFENLRIAVNTSDTSCWSDCRPHIATFDNCEFSNLGSVLDGEQYGDHHSLFEDSHVHDVDAVAVGESATFFNNLIENFGTVLADGEWNFNFSNNTIQGNGTQDCLVFDKSTFEGNIIDGCGVAITTGSSSNTIRYNTFSNHGTAIVMGSKSGGSEANKDTVTFNNFVSNTVALSIAPDTRDDDQPNCNYNYFGATTQTAIAGMILDVCDGQAVGLVTFWPYFLDTINFYDFEHLPTTGTISDLACPGVDNGHSAGSSALKAAFVEHTTLTAADSPFYVVGDVLIPDGINVTFENGVEIIFMADYDIIVRGNLDFCGIDTSNDQSQGLANAAVHGHIHGDSGLSRVGSFLFESGGTNGRAQFCNVLFENMRYAIDSNTGGCHSTDGCEYLATLDNCQFRNLHRAFYGYSTVGDGVLFKDSHFTQITEVAYRSAVTFENNLIENFGSVVPFQSYYGTFIGNTIRGNGTQDCLYRIERAVIERNTIDSCSTAITTHWWYNTIQYNTFSNHGTAIMLGPKKSGDNQDTINFNNFVSNTIAISSDSAANYAQPYCNLNYFGVNSYDPAVIAALVNDVCDDGAFGNALVTFWPWFTTEYTTASTPPTMFSFDFDDCASFDTAISRQLTWFPTTASPTTASPTSPTTSTASPTTSTTSPTTGSPTTSHTLGTNSSNLEPSATATPASTTSRSPTTAPTPTLSSTTITVANATTPRTTAPSVTSESTEESRQQSTAGTTEQATEESTDVPQAAGAFLLKLSALGHLFAAICAAFFCF